MYKVTSTGYSGFEVVVSVTDMLCAFSSLNFQPHFHFVVVVMVVVLINI